MTTPDGGNYGNGGNQPGRWGQQPAFGAYPTGPTGPTAPTGPRDSFWSALFDFSFTKYATPSIIKFAYALGFVFIALTWVVYALFVIVGMGSELGAGGVLLGLVIAVVLTVGALFTLMMMRMMLEFYLSNIRIAQAAQSIDERDAGRR
jgi:hypothetical protein